MIFSGMSFVHSLLKSFNVYIRGYLVSYLGTGDLILLGSRHPCLEVQDDVAFIPNDVQLLRGINSFIM